MSDNTTNEAAAGPQLTFEEHLALLTPKQVAFLDALPQNNWQAYRTIRSLEFSTHTLWKWQKDEHFVAVRDMLQHNHLEAVGATYERTMLEVSRIAYADIRQVLGKSNKLTDADTWDDETAAAISSIETETRFEGRGDDVEEIVVTKIKTHPKLDALKQLLAIHGKLIERHEHTGKDGAPLQSTAPIVNVIIGARSKD